MQKTEIGCLTLAMKASARLDYGNKK